MSKQLRKEYEYHLTLALKSGPKKCSLYLLEMSDACKDRGLSPNRFHLPMSFLDVASYLCIRHESISRTMAQLQERHLIEKRGKLITVLDLKAIRDAAEA